MRTGDPADLKYGSHDRNSPYCSKKRNTDVFWQNDHADWCIRTGNQYKDHGVIDLAQNFVDRFGDIKCMICGACRI